MEDIVTDPETNNSKSPAYYAQHICEKNIYQKIQNYSQTNGNSNVENDIFDVLKEVSFFCENFQNLVYYNLHKILIINKYIKDIEPNIKKAIKHKDLKSIKFLIENNIYDINKFKDKDFLKYAQNSSLDIYNYLLQYFPTNTQSSIQKPTDYVNDIFKATQMGKLTSVQWLIEKEKVDKNKKDDDGKTLLICACENGDIEIALYLLSKGADSNAKDNYGNSVIHFASMNGLLQIVQCLIEKHKVNKDSKGSKDRTPLHYACEAGKYLIVEYLVSIGANIEAKDKLYGRTPLHFAALWNKKDIVELLISYGANKKAKDSKGQTPYNLSDKKEIQALLQ